MRKSQKGKLDVLCLFAREHRAFPHLLFISFKDSVRKSKAIYGQNYEKAKTKIQQWPDDVIIQNFDHC